jgi:hypothetical protein
MALTVVDGLDVIFGTCYNANGDIHEMELIMEKALDDLPNNLPILFMGDFNIDTMLPLSSEAKNFLGMMSMMGFSHTVDTITRPASNSCIDNIFVRGNDSFVNILPGTLNLLPADHYPVFLYANFFTSGYIPKVLDPPKRNFSIRNKNKFADQLKKIDWSPLYLCHDVNQQMEIFDAVLLDMFDLCFP